MEDAIRSVLAQSWDDWECIVTDDANSAAAREVCDRFATEQRIRYRANHSTLGAPLNIAAALSRARGKYVVILNDYDLLNPRMLEQLVPPLETNPEVVVAFGNHEVMDAGGVVLIRETAELMRRVDGLRLTPGVFQTR